LVSKLEGLEALTNGVCVVADGSLDVSQLKLLISFVFQAFCGGLIVFHFTLLINY